jgi:hypothetical protein
MTCWIVWYGMIQKYWIEIGVWFGKQLNLAIEQSILDTNAGKQQS